MICVGVKYQEFVSDIRTLGNGLNRLKNVVEAAEKQYPRREWRGDEQHIGDAQNLWPQLTGDFYQTLKECESLLTRHGRLRNGHARPLDNLTWWLSAEGAVDNLMAKLKFHITKVEFYARPSQLEMLLRQGRDLQQLRRQLANLERMMRNGAEPSAGVWGHIIPTELKARLEHELFANRPSWFADGSQMPLKDGFEALVFHFARGTVTFTPLVNASKMPGLEQFIHLAKAFWIFENLKENQNIRVGSTESFWADYMRELEDDLRGQFHRFESGELEAPPVQTLLNLTGDYYTISKGEKAKLEAAAPSGEQLLQMTLMSESSESELSLVVFRESDVDFTFVKSTRQPDVLEAPRNREVEVFMDRHRLIPIYGCPNQGQPLRNSVIISNERGRRSTDYAFRTLNDVVKLQRALTGYRVHHHMPVSRWRINGTEKVAHSVGGFVQLWQHKPLPAMSASNLSKGSDAGSSQESTESPIPGSNLSRRPQSGETDINISDGRVGSFSDFMVSNGFPDQPLSRSPTSSFPGLISAQPRNARRSSGLSYQSTNRLSQASSTGQFTQRRQSSQNAPHIRTGSITDSANHRRSSSAYSGTTQISRASVLSPVQGPRQNGTQAVRPELPVLIIFTMCDAKYSFLHLIRKFSSCWPR